MRISDWSSDVCSSDLTEPPAGHREVLGEGIDDDRIVGQLQRADAGLVEADAMVDLVRHQADARLAAVVDQRPHLGARSEEHTSELQSLMRISYAVFCLKKKKHHE